MVRSDKVSLKELSVTPLASRAKEMPKDPREHPLWKSRSMFDKSLCFLVWCKNRTTVIEFSMRPIIRLLARCLQRSPNERI